MKDGGCADKLFVAGPIRFLIKLVKELFEFLLRIGGHGKKWQPPQLICRSGIACMALDEPR